MKQIIIFLLVAGACSAASRDTIGAPMIYLSLLGRTDPADAYSHSVAVLPGQNVDYEVVLQMAPLGTSNTQGATTRTLQYWTPGLTGVNSMFVDLFQYSTDPVQVNLTPSVLNSDPTSQANDSWSAGTGANPGRPTPRPGASGFNDLIAVRPIHAAGVCTGIDPEVVLTGSFQVPVAAEGLGSLVRLRWGTDAASAHTSGGFRINSGTSVSDSVIVFNTTEAGPDPFVAIDPPLPDASQTLSAAISSMSTSAVDESYALQLTLAPEPSSAVLIGLAGAGLLRRRRRM